ncbi:MAG: amidohydrolase [Alphaproteobacteria bacterium BRH_c36]|nr:MAG: amidohydrolase [Alphaproteobacteria bacterium BRH_c36]
MSWLSKEDLERVELLAKRTDLQRRPIPDQVVSNGEYRPMPQTPQQRQVAALIDEMADERAPSLGMDRRGFLQTSLGLATAFAAMNVVYGDVFSVAQAETRDSDAMAETAARYADQFIFDGHMHFVADDYKWDGILGLRHFGAVYGNPDIGKDDKAKFQDLQIDNFIKEVFLDSDTTVGLVSSATADDPANIFLTNPQLVDGAMRINKMCGSRRLLRHAIFEPGKDGWLDEVDRVIEKDRPDSWKGYTVGDPLAPSKYPYRLDDEKLMYPFYDRTRKAGIRNVCIHKGLLPSDYEESFRDTWRFATVEDVAKAAKDWPELNFIIYHSALKPLTVPPEEHLARFEKTGRIDWVSDLAEIPEKHGVTNVYADIGTTFATTCLTHPRHAAALMGILIKGLGVDRVVWGTDAVWYGSPQWQIEAFRRMEIPEDLRERYGFAPLGDGLSATKTAIFGGTSAKLYDFTAEEATVAHYANDRLSEYRKKYNADGADRSNIAYGFIHAG